MIKFVLINKLLLLIFLLGIITTDNDLLALNVNNTVTTSTSSNQILKYFLIERKQGLDKFNQDSLLLYKQQAIIAARSGDVVRASNYLENYIRYSGDTEFVNNDNFSRFKNSEEFTTLSNKFMLNFSWLNFFYLFSALVGFFIGFMLLLVKKKNKAATLLISVFVLIHSVFIFHLFLYLTNLQFRVPNSAFMSSIFSYLYGPLIYFYFKKVTLNYQFRKIDLLHLVPTLIIIIIMLPVFFLPAQEKLRIILRVGSFDTATYLIYGFSTKLLSLLIYGSLTLRIYLRIRKQNNFSIEAQKWIRYLVTLTEVYIVSYFIYGFIIIKVIPKSEFLFNLQIVAMASMVLYIGYKSYVRPNLFTLDLVKRKNKYNKSGLTPSFSLELKAQLLNLLETEKVYRQNNINLAVVSNRLGTTRHNTSQVINEHFGLNFFELINKYRIEEAQNILKGDKNNNLNIIDVAYEVGFNNKVTFNKSFRKQLSITPSQYLSSLNL